MTGSCSPWEVSPPEEEDEADDDSMEGTEGTDEKPAQGYIQGELF